MTTKLIKIALTTCLYSLLTSAFAVEIPPKPEACPDITLTKNIGFVDSLPAPEQYSSTLTHYIGAYQINTYGTKQLWEIQIAKTYEETTLHLPFYGVAGSAAAAKLARSILATTSGTPTPSYFSDKNDWECSYDTDAAGKNVVAITPVPTVKEEE
jgi:hypothetical protein